MRKYKSLIFPAICLYISYFLYHIIVEGWGVGTTEPFLMPLGLILISFSFGLISYLKKSWTFIGTVRRTMIIFAIIFFLTLFIA